MQVALTPGSAAHEFACHSKACAPPPAGHGGSDSRGGKRTALHPSEATGMVGKSERNFSRGGSKTYYRAKGARAHTKAFISRLMKQEKFAKSKISGPTKGRKMVKNPVGYKVHSGMTREQARARGAQI